MNKKLYAAIMVATISGSLLAGCGDTPTAVPTPNATQASTVDATATKGTTAVATATKATGVATATTGTAGKKFTIGISNPFISSEYRTQMIQELTDTNKEYKDQGITNDLVIESADTDVPGQIQQLQNLISKGVDAILVNPGDVNGLNDTLQAAVAKGILVISVDQELATPNVYNVGIDQKQWAETSAKWLATKLGGKGNIVEIEGLPRPPRQCSSHERRG